MLEWRKSVHYWWSYILFAPECKELTCMLDPLLLQVGCPTCCYQVCALDHEREVQQTWITIQSPVVVMNFLEYKIIYYHYYVWIVLTSKYLTHWGQDKMAAILQATFSKTLTHWSQVTRLCVSNLTIIGSDNGLLPNPHQANIWTYDGILLIGPTGITWSSMKFLSKFMHFHSRNSSWKPCLENGSHFASTFNGFSEWKCVYFSFK